MYIHIRLSFFSFGCFDDVFSVVRGLSITIRMIFVTLYNRIKKREENEKSDETEKEDEEESLCTVSAFHFDCWRWWWMAVDCC